MTDYATKYHRPIPSLTKLAMRIHHNRDSIVVIVVTAAYVALCLVTGRI